MWVGKAESELSYSIMKSLFLVTRNQNRGPKPCISDTKFKSQRTATYCSLNTIKEYRRVLLDVQRQVVILATRGPVSIITDPASRFNTHLIFAFKALIAIYGFRVFLD
ncbi:uncharacterized protein LOC126673136 [Mercurialis annua]|uniref:uncharacterized protein LOC126673136 n=1 Tax=Mercurialis annua TaxID=3986 RepID=UPI002160AC86|nr:uncharacterized protein LOC126673136 [Mercurialis annua]XP_055960927.1 uncharacterized protein LOC126673136 [Mercurialis annua]